MRGCGPSCRFFPSFDLPLDKPNPSIRIDRGTLEIVGQGGLRQSSISRSSPASASELTDRSFYPIALLHPLLELFGLRFSTTLLEQVMVFSHHQHPPSTSALGTLLLKRAPITQPGPFKPIIHLAGLLILKPTTLAILMAGRTDRFAMGHIHIIGGGVKEVFARSVG